MPYEVLSRTLAYLSCITAMSLFATSMSIAAVNVGRMLSDPCSGSACVAAHATANGFNFGGLTDRAHVDAVSAVLWSRKI